MSLQIIFMGTPEFSINTFNSIIKSGHKVLRVYTQPPKKKLRGQKILKSPIHLIANKHNIDVKTPNNLDNESDYTFFSSTKIDLVVVVAYGKIIPEKYFRIPNLMFLNLHASLLPKWRGAAPIQRSILSHDSETGISIMKLISKLDEGPVMKQTKLQIQNNISAGELSNKLSIIGAKALVESLDLISQGKAIFKEQDNLKSSYAKKINKSESKINWSDEAKNILAKINAFNPKPGAWFTFGNERIKVFKAIEINSKGKPGEVLDKELTVATGKSSIKILELQKEGKSILSSQEFLKGTKILKGDNLT